MGCSRGVSLAQGGHGLSHLPGVQNVRNSLSQVDESIESRLEADHETQTQSHDRLQAGSLCFYPPGSKSCAHSAHHSDPVGCASSAICVIAQVKGTTRVAPYVFSVANTQKLAVLL